MNRKPQARNRGHRRSLVSVDPYSTTGRLLFTILLLAAISGCGGDRPPLGTVSGVVTLDGAPLADACVVFEPVEPGRMSMGWTNAKGEYRLVYIRDEEGAKVGPHYVRITTANPEAGKPELLPAGYHVQTTLRRDVKASRNEFDFTLTTR